MTPRRLSVKLFSTAPEAPVALEPWIPFFHKVIQQSSVEGLLVDVADYAHVPNGPGVILVGHDVDYGIDRVAGRTGLLTVRKRIEWGSLGGIVRDTLRMAVGCVKAVHDDGSTGVEFAVDQVKIDVLDRRVAPNTDAAFAAVKAELEPVLQEIFDGGVELERAQADDPRDALCVSLRAPGATVDALLAALGAAPAPAPAAVVSDVPPEQRQTEWDISAEALKRLKDSHADMLLIDVREQGEYETCNIGGQLIPLGSLADKLDQIPKGAHIVVHCHLGPRSSRAVHHMREIGFDNVWNLNGGIRAWIQRIDSSLQDLADITRQVSPVGSKMRDAVSFLDVPPLRQGPAELFDEKGIPGRQLADHRGQLGRHILGIQDRTDQFIRF